MSNLLKSPRLPEKDLPRVVLAEDFPNASSWPIEGGWGYDLESSVVINKKDPRLANTDSFNYVDFEYVFIEKRIYEELIVYRHEDARFSGIEWFLNLQTLQEHNGRKYDVLSFNVSAFPDSAWNKLKADWILHNGFENDPSGLAEHEGEREKVRVNYETQYWFDIDDFF